MRGITPNNFALCHQNYSSAARGITITQISGCSNVLFYSDGWWYFNSSAVIWQKLHKNTNTPMIFTDYLFPLTLLSEYKKRGEKRSLENKWQVVASQEKKSSFGKCNETWTFIGIGQTDYIIMNLPDFQAE